MSMVRSTSLRLATEAPCQNDDEYEVDWIDSLHDIFNWRSPINSQAVAAVCFDTADSAAFFPNR